MKKERVYLANDSDFWADIEAPFRVYMWRESNENDHKNDAWVWYDNGLNGIVDVDDFKAWRDNSCEAYPPSDFIKRNHTRLRELDSKANRADYLISEIENLIQEHKEKIQ